MMTRLLRPALLAALIGAPLALPLSPLAAVDAPASSDDLAAVSKAIRAISTLQAAFTQTDRNGNVLSGTMKLKQPGHIRFDYGDGAEMLIVAQGGSLYFIDYEVNQVQRWPIRNSPLGALLNPQRDLARYGKIVPSDDPRVISIDVRDPQHPEYGRINMVFTRDATKPGGLLLYGWVALDAQGNRTSIRLINPVYGSTIPASAFDWKDPRPSRVGPRR